MSSNPSQATYFHSLIFLSLALIQVRLFTVTHDSVHTLTFAYWLIFMLLLSTADFFQNGLFQKKYFGNTIRVSNSLDPDLGLNCLQRLISRQQKLSLARKEL